MKNATWVIALLIGASLNSKAQSLPEIIKNGTSKLAAGDYAGAEKDFANAIKVNVAVVDSYLDKMKKYSTMNEYQRSTSDMPDGFVYNHDLAVPYFGHGAALIGLDRNEEAFTDLDKAVSIDPKYADAICERGIALIGKGVKDKGCMDLRKAKALGSEKAKEYYDKNACSGMSGSFVTSGTTKMEAKDYKAAAEDFTAAIQLNSESNEALLKRAECNVYLKKYDKAISDYNKALKINPDSVKILYLRGLAYHAAENFKSAFNDFTEVIKLSPNNYDAYMARGASCEGMVNFKSAAYDYSEAIRIKPKDGIAYYKRGLANQDAKDNSACKDFKMAAALGVEDAKSWADGCDPPPVK